MIALDTGDKLRAYASVADKIDYTVHGMVNDNVGQLSDGQLAGAEADIYTAPSDAGIVSTLVFVNTHNATVTCNLYLKPSGGTSRRIIPKDTSLDTGCSLHYDGIRLIIASETGEASSVIVITHPADTFVAEDGALGKGVLLQGDDGTDRKNVAVNASGKINVIEQEAANIETHLDHIETRFQADGEAIDYGLLVQGNDGTDRHNLEMAADGDLKVTLDSEAIVLGAGTAAIGKLAANSGIDIGDVDVKSHPADTFVAEDGALGKGVLLQGDDGTDRKNLQTNANGDLKVTLDSEAVILGTGTAAIGKLAANSGVDIGDVDVLSLPALVAGTAAIGKLAANSGVDIGDVDVLSLPSLIAGSAKIGSVDAGKKSGTWTSIVINISTATTTELKAGSAGHTYTVYTISLTIAAENNLTWKSAANAISGPMDFGATGEPHGWQANLWPCGLKCVAGEALQLTTSTTGQVSGFIAVLDES